MYFPSVLLIQENLHLLAKTYKSCLEEQIQWNPVNTVTNGLKIFGRCGRINEITVFFYKLALFARWPKKGPVIVK